MKQFFKMMFASAFGFILSIVVLVILFIFGSVAVVGSLMSENSNYKPDHKEVFELTLEGNLTDYADDDPFTSLWSEEKTLSVNEVLRAIKKAKETKAISGIYLNVKTFSAGVSSIDAIRRALKDFRTSGKFVVSYADQYGQGGYYLASCADKVFMNPQGLLDIHGLSFSSMFYTGILKKIGVQMQIFKVGTYKGAVEPYMLNKYSDANREQLTSVATTIWDNMTENISKSRGITAADVNEFAEKGLMFGAQEEAVSMGLIDELKYRHDAELYIKEAAEQYDDDLDVAKLKQILNIKSKEVSAEDKIAVIYAQGEITQDETSSPSMNMEATITEELAKRLRDLKEDEEVKAVVLRVNSPGGSAYTSDQIWKAMKELKTKKPVVVSMANVAASGGYYISCAANKIVAERNTLTGSIGIFGQFPNVAGLYDKLDLTTDVVKTNKFADFGDISRPMTEDEKALLQAYIERGYDTFLSRCAEGRKMSKEAIDKIGQGRVWTGEQAKDRGLVDEIGGLNDAINLAATLADVSVYEVEERSGSESLMDKLKNEFLVDVKVKIAREVMGDEMYKQACQLKRLRNSTGVMARLPFEYNFAQ